MLNPDNDRGQVYSKGAELKGKSSKERKIEYITMERLEVWS